MVFDMNEATTLKDHGNDCFKKGEFKEAISEYSKAIACIDCGRCCPDDPADLAELNANLLKNRAACYLKVAKYDLAKEDTSKALEIQPGDRKAMFRLSQALQHLGLPDQAYKHAIRLLHAEPKNKAFQEMCRALRQSVDEKVDEQSSLGSQVVHMTKVAFDDNSPTEKRVTALNNLIVLERDQPAAANMLFDTPGITENICALLLPPWKNADMIIAAERVLGILVSDNRLRAQKVFATVGMGNLVALVAQPDEEPTCLAASNLLKPILFASCEYSKFKDRRDAYDRRALQAGTRAGLGPPPRLTMDETAQDRVDEIFGGLVRSLNSSKASGTGRDCVMKLLSQAMQRKEGLAWCPSFVTKTDGVSRLLEVSAVRRDVPDERLKTTGDTRQHISLLFALVDDDMTCDQERDSYRDQCEQFFHELLTDERMDSKIEAITALTVLLQGPFEMANAVLGRSGVLEMMLAMAEADNALFQKIAVEALVCATSRKDKCSGIIKRAVPILKKLYACENDYVKVRALVGLCKLGSFGGTDASARSFADGSTVQLGKACRRFMTNPAKDMDLRRWAAEGLAFLTLDADVKEDLMGDETAMRNIADLAKHGEMGVWYAIATIFVNVTNSYEKKEADPELVELAKFSKQHVPEEHTKDTKDYVDRRVSLLAKYGAVNALVTMSSTESEQTRDLLSRVYHVIASDEPLRGLIVQQGGAKALIPLALRNNSAVGLKRASQALAQIAITMKPDLAFPGQRALEIVRPILTLLDVEAKSIQNYEALLALTNLASFSPSLRKRIHKERGQPLIENYMYDDHEELRRASVECMCNLVQNEDVAAAYAHPESERVKLWVLLCIDPEQEADVEEEDVALVRAASGGLAILTASPDICFQITKVKSWLNILSRLLTHLQPEVMHRGAHIIMNMMQASFRVPEGDGHAEKETKAKEMAQFICESRVFHLVMALSVLKEKDRAGARKCALEAIDAAIELGLVAPNPSAAAAAQQPS